MSHQTVASVKARLAQESKPQTVASVKARVTAEQKAADDAITQALFDDGIITHVQQPLPAGVTQEPILSKPLPMHETSETYKLLIRDLKRYDKMVAHKIVEWNKRATNPTTMRKWLTNSDVTAGLGLSAKNVGEINKRLRIFYTTQINQVISLDYNGNYIHEVKERIKW